jgi:hypothetical protein
MARYVVLGACYNIVYVDDVYVVTVLTHETLAFWYCQRWIVDSCTIERTALVFLALFYYNIVYV